MKKYFIILILILVLIYIISCLYFKNNIQFSSYQSTNYKLLTTNYKLLIADTPAKQEKGLMYVTKKDGFDGMIFIFPNKEYLTFWNKNTLVDLDLYWLDGDKVVGKSFLPSIEKSKNIISVSSPKPANRVIELIK